VHFRICVDCGEEYRPEIAVCADCGGALQDRYEHEGQAAAPEPSVEAPSDPSEEFTQTLLFDENATRLVEPADTLVAQGIACRIRQNQAVRRAPSAAGDAQRDAAAARVGYWLCVRPEDVAAALVSLGLPPPGTAEEAQAASAAESRPCPACGGVVAGREVECPDCGLMLGDEPEPEQR
jgi:hypothetical protein